MTMSSYLLPLVKNNGKTIAFIGGGGKTTIIFNLAKQLANKGNKVIITTTTHMYEPVNITICQEEKEIKEAFHEHNIVFVSTEANDGKVKGVDVNLLNRLNQYANYVLIEADGARGLPLKAPREHEPAIPENADTVVAVVGLDCIGKTLGSMSFCTQQVIKVLEEGSVNAKNILKDKIDEDHIIMANDIVKIVVSQNGYKKNVDKRDFKVILNKADNIERISNANNIAEMLNKYYCIECFITSFKESERIYR